MQQASKNRLSAKISALLVAILTLGSLPLANTSKALQQVELQFLTTAATVTEGNTILLTIVGDPTANLSFSSNTNFSYSITGTADTNNDLIFNNTPGVAAGGMAIEGGTNRFQIPVTIVDDSNTEGPETIVITLTDAQGNHTILGANTTFTITVNDNDGLPFINFTSLGSQGFENQPAVLTVELSRTSTEDVTFQWSTDASNTTAQSTETIIGGNTFPADYTNAPVLIPATITIPAGQSTVSINLGIYDDNLYEPTEMIEAGFTGSVTNAQFGTNSYHLYTIYDNDTPSIQFVSAGSAGDERSPSHSFTVTFSKPSTEDTELTISTNGISTARDGDLSVDGNDWYLPNVMRIMPAGQTSLPVSINIKDDADTEGDETAVVTIQFAPQGFDFGPILNYTYTIIDDESLPPASSGSSSSGASGTAIPQSTASVGGVAVGSDVTVPTPVVTSPVVTTPAPTTPGQVLGVQTSLVNELIAKLKFGSTSDEVNQLQVELQKLGFFSAKMKTTRYYGLVTKAAVQKYLDAKVNTMSLGELVSVLKFGQKSNAVKRLQNELKTAGFFPANSTATGFYGNLTKQAVANYLAR